MFAPAMHPQKQSTALAFAGCAALSLGIGAADLFTGTEIRVYPLYFLPISVAAWRLGPRSSAAIIILSLITWFSSNYAAGLRYSSGSIWAINSMAHAISFSVVGILIGRLHRSVLAEQKLARIDALTHLPNSRAFFELAEREISRMSRSQAPITVAYMDLDKFKEVNDRFGHRTGDDVLREVGELLESRIREPDIAARLAGDEFAFVLPDASPEDALQVLERLRTDIQASMQKSGWPISASIGAVCFLTPPTSVDEALGAADALLYRVKETGRNRVRLDTIKPGQSVTTDLLHEDHSGRIPARHA